MGISFILAAAMTLLQGTVWTAEGGPTKVTFDGNRVSGTLACNNFSASYRVDGDALSLGGVNSTRKFCGAADAMREHAMVQKLGQVVSFSLEGDVLSLLGKKGEVLLRFNAKA